MILRDVVAAIALLLLPVCLIGMLASCVGGYVHAMFFWAVLWAVSFCVLGILSDPHGVANSRKSFRN